MRNQNDDTKILCKLIAIDNLLFMDLFLRKLYLLMLIVFPFLNLNVFYGVIDVAWIIASHLKVHYFGQSGWMCTLSTPLPDTIFH